MTPESRLTADWRELIERWQALATEARQRADQRRRGDPDPAYFCMDVLTNWSATPPPFES